MGSLDRAPRRLPQRSERAVQGRNPSEPSLFQMVNVEALVPPDHWLRRLDAVLDLSFVHEAVEGCYAEGRGRPGIDPELALRMMLLGRLYDLSDRELCEEVAMHAGMRWFCRLDFHDPVPDHSTLSRLRNERWAQSGLFERLFDEVVRQCAEAGMVSGRHLSLDGTEVAADCSLKSLAPATPRPAGPDPDPPPGGEGAACEPQPEGVWRGHGQRLSNETHRSRTDPDARLYRKGGGREARLSYLAHDLIDTKSRVILRRRASRAHSGAEREVGLQMLDEVLENGDALGLPVRPEVLTADTGYGTGAFVADVLDRGLLPHIALQASEEREELPTWVRRTHRLDWQRKRAEKVRLARARNRTRALHKTRGYRVSRKLRIRSEHGFAEGKTRHGMGRARRRGLTRVDQQMLLTGVVQNLKRLAGYVHRRRRGAGAAALRASEATSRALSAPSSPVFRRTLRHSFILRSPARPTPSPASRRGAPSGASHRPGRAPSSTAF